MLRRFAAGSVVACVAIAIASAVVLMTSGLNFQRLSLALAIWCVVPCGWGVWAMLSPASWVPQRLPMWGTILGIVAGVLAIFVVKMPYRVLGVVLPATAGALGVLVAGVFYYVLWTMVRMVYKGLGGSSSPASRG